MSTPYREPDFLPWDGRRVPLTFVAGYLGAGKTTLINRVLEATDRPVAVIVNDVGEINIDARLIRRHSGDTIELADGCMCCSMVDGVGAAFDTIRARPTPPDHVIVELSGVAEPARMLPWGHSAGFVLDGVLTLLAADRLDDLLARPDLAMALEAQLTAADLVAVTRIDLASADEVAAAERFVADVAPHARVLRADDPALVATMLRLGGRRDGGVADVGVSTLFDRHVVESRPLPPGISRAELDAELDALPPDTMRAKGVAMADDGTKLLVQVVGSRRVVTELAEPEDQPPTDLVVIRLPV